MTLVREFDACDSKIALGHITPNRQSANLKRQLEQCQRSHFNFGFPLCKGLREFFHNVCE